MSEIRIGATVYAREDPTTRFVVAAIVMRDEPVARLCKVSFLGVIGDWIGDWLLSDLWIV